MLNNQLGQRLVVLTAVCTSLALGTAATVAAYPIAPEGEPLHLEAGMTPPLPASGSVASKGAGGATSTPANAVPLAEVSRGGTDWIETSLTVMASIALLALAVAGLTLTGRLRGSARTE